MNIEIIGTKEEIRITKIGALIFALSLSTLFFFNVWLKIEQIKYYRAGHLNQQIYSAQFSSLP